MTAPAYTSPDGRATVWAGDCLDVLRGMADGSVDAVVTSPPYWGLRDYGNAPREWPAVECVPLAGVSAVTVPAESSALGLETTPTAFVAHLVLVFREVRRMLRDDGTAWVNLGDSYAGSRCGAQGITGQRSTRWFTFERGEDRNAPGLKTKDLVGIPWRVAFALQADGWYLRSDVIWHKPNPMPESIADRPTKAHEYVYLLAKSERYYYDADAVRERWADERCGASGARRGLYAVDDRNDGGMTRPPRVSGRNKRSVWTIATQPFPEAHFATFPIELPRTCIRASVRAGGIVLDPFGGAGGTAVAALREGRRAVLVEVQPKYVDIIRRRLDAETRQGVLPFIFDAGACRDMSPSVDDAGAQQDTFSFVPDAAREQGVP